MVLYSVGPLSTDFDLDCWRRRLKSWRRQWCWGRGEGRQWISSSGCVQSAQPPHFLRTRTTSNVVLNHLSCLGYAIILIAHAWWTNLMTKVSKALSYKRFAVESEDSFEWECGTHREQKSFCWVKNNMMEFPRAGELMECLCAGMLRNWIACIMVSKHSKSLIHCNEMLQFL